MGQKFPTVGVIVFTGIALVLYFFLSRWVFLVKKRVRLQQAQLYISLQVAKKQDIPDSDIRNAAEIADGLIDIDFTEVYPKTESK